MLGVHIVRHQLCSDTKKHQRSQIMTDPPTDEQLGPGDEMTLSTCLHLVLLLFSITFSHPPRLQYVTRYNGGLHRAAHV